MSNLNRSTYSYRVYNQTIAIFDHDKGRSVTNDVVNVIEDLRQEGLDLTSFRIIYRDTQEIWDEIVLKDGKFQDFRSINTKDLDTALLSLA